MFCPWKLYFICRTMKIKKLSKIFSGVGRVFFKRIGVVVVLALVNRWVKGAVVVFFLVTGLWLLYSQVWKTFQGEVVLPSSVGATRIQLKVEVLRKIDTDRSNRVRYKATDYTRYDRLFDFSSGEEAD